LRAEGGGERQGILSNELRWSDARYNCLEKLLQ
jgi:hypothetical protein